MADQLAGLQLEVLAFERTPFKHAGAKATEIRRWFGFSDTRYHQVLTAAIAQPAAETYDPELVRRLRRLQATRRRHGRAHPQAGRW